MVNIFFEQWIFFYKVLQETQGIFYGLHRLDRQRNSLKLQFLLV